MLMSYILPGHYKNICITEKINKPMNQKKKSSGGYLCGHRRSMWSAWVAGLQWYCQSAPPYAGLMLFFIPYLYIYHFVFLKYFIKIFPKFFLKDKIPNWTLWGQKANLDFRLLKSVNLNIRVHIITWIWLTKLLTFHF